MLLRVLICAIGVAATGAPCGLGQSADPLPGEKKWEFLTDSAVVGCPALGTNGLLYAVTLGGHVFALDATSGQLRWETNFGGSIYSSPICHVGPEGTLYVSRNDTLHAFDGETGEEKWIQGFEGAYGYTPTLAIGPDGMLYALHGYLYALDPATGLIRWEWEGDYLRGTPVLGANGLLYVSGGYGKIIAVSTSTGQRVWEFWLDDYSLVPSALGPDGTLFASASEGQFVALNGATGEQLWQFQTNDWLLASVVIDAEGTLYLSGNDNTLRVLDGETGVLQRELPIPAANSVLTLAADDTLYVSAGGLGQVFAFDLMTGSTNWVLETGSFSVPALNVGTDGTVFAGLGTFWGMGGLDGIYAIRGSSPLADTAWPKVQQNAQNTGGWRVTGVPRITGSPQDHWSAVDATTTFRFYSPTLRPLHVQWRFSGQAMAGATNEILRIPEVHFTHAGSYSVIISNQFGQAISDEATLSVGYAINLSTIGPGVVEREPNLPVYPTNTVVTLTAVPREERAFLGWSTDVTNASDTLTLTLDRNYDLLASFEYLPGDVKWKSRFARGTQALGTNGLLYSPTIRDSLIAINTTNGQMVWEKLLSANVESPPAVGPDGTVYIGDYGGNLWALNGSTGEQKWRFNFLGVCLHTCPAFGIDGTLYLTGGRLCAVNPETGAEFWSFDGAANISPVVGSDGTLYACGDGGLFAFDGLTRQIKWQIPDGASAVAIGTNGTIYVGCLNNQFRAVDAATGATVWDFEIPISDRASPIIGPDNTVYIYSRDARVYALDGQTGEKKWDFLTTDGLGSTPALTADGTLYIASYDRRLYAVDASTGEEKWQLVLDGAHYGEGGPVVAADGTLYVVGSAVHGTSPLAASAWPRFRRGAENSGRPPLRPLLNPARSRLTPAGFEVVVHSDPGEVLWTEWSSDFVRWNPLSVATNRTGTLQLLDPAAPASSMRFYRSRKSE